MNEDESLDDVKIEGELGSKQSSSGAYHYVREQRRSATADDGNPSILTSVKRVTPMMQQYLDSKQQHQDCLLLFRMGDFYELFYEDAIKAAPILGVALTRRGKTEGQDIPMCGVPHHSVDFYVRKLIKAGQKVAMCDQLESPEDAKKRGGSSALVRRDVTRVITAGTLTEDGLLEGKAANYLAAVVRVKNGKSSNGSTPEDGKDGKDGKASMAIAYAELSTLDFWLLPTSSGNLANDLARINPSELLVADSLLADAEFKSAAEEFRPRFVVFADQFFSPDKCERKLKQNFGLHTLEGLGSFSPAQLAAAGGLIEYLCITQKKEAVALKFPRLLDTADYVVIDRSTIRNLEIFNSIGEHGQSLFQVIDQTLTNAGGRLLRNFLSFPSRNVAKIEARLHLVRTFIEQDQLRASVMGALKHVPDLERSVGRLTVGRGTPRDLYNVREALEGAEKIAQAFAAVGVSTSDKNLEQLSCKLKKGSSVLELLNRALIQYEIYINHGDYILRGYDLDLDRLYNFRDNGDEIIDRMRDEYRNKTGISGLKLEFNNMLGYYIEVTKGNAAKIQGEEFIQRQTMVNCVRYVTEKLKDAEAKILDARNQISEIEKRVFAELGRAIVSASKELTIVANAVAHVDVMHSFAKLAIEQNYCAPVLDADSCGLEIRDGRHPVVEYGMAKEHDGESFIVNDCQLAGQQKLWLITGPNMSGKSTFLRQNALIVLLAHIGSYVPASYARIGVVDRIFSRIGAEDDLVKGRSTFLVEMVETATILNQATERSLIILDEVGRGTSTYDGIAIAWSCLEHIHDHKRARTLFSTHYHELVELSAQLANLKCFTVSVKEWGGKVIFMRKLVAGVANRSYGINVAEIAGLPRMVIDRAKAVLAKLHASGELIGEKMAAGQKMVLGLADQLQSKLGLELNGFGELHSQLAEPKSSGDMIAVNAQDFAQLLEIKRELDKLDTDGLSPRAALDVLCGLKEKLRG